MSDNVNCIHALMVDDLISNGIIRANDNILIWAILLLYKNLYNLVIRLNCILCS